jgi:hypothetical protein
MRTHTDERAWARGARGERVVAWFLGRPPDCWHVFHDVPVGERGANIDHVVVGPAGVFTINTKNLHGVVRVTPRGISVNGVPTPFLPKAKHEAARASRLLSAASGHRVDVLGALAVIADRIEVRGMPEDIYVGSPRGVRRWMLQLPPRLTENDVIAIAGAASKPATWRDVRSAGDTCPCGGTLVERIRRRNGARFLGCSRYPSCRRTWSEPPR